MKTIFKRRKGQEFSVGTEVLPTIFAAVVTIAIAIWLVVLIFRIQNDVITNQQQRDSIAYASALVANEQLAYVDGDVKRGLLDGAKLDAMQSKGCGGLNFKYAEYSLIVIDREDVTDGVPKTWIICDDARLKVSLPVAIYRNGEVHRGSITVGAPKQDL